MKKLIAHAALLAVFIHPIIFGQSGWVWLNPLPQGNYLTNVSYVNGSLVYVSGYGGTLMKSTNGGNNFAIIPTGIREPLKLNFINELTGFSASGAGILRTTDGGYNWQYFQLPSEFETGPIQYTSAMTLFALKAGAVGNTLVTNLYKSTDLGVTWSLSLSPAPNTSVYSYHFPDSYTGYAVGRKQVLNQYSKIYKTTNAGMSWDSVASSVKYELQASYFVNSTTGYVYTHGLRDLILKTTNSCLSWDTVYVEPIPFINSLKFFDNINGYASGNQDIAITTNSGMNWNYYPTDHNLILFNINDGLGIGAGYYWNFVFKTTNSGNNWTQITQGFFDELLDVVFINDNTGFTVGDNKIYKTTNSGTNWSIYNLNLQGWTTVENIMFVNQNTGYAGIDGGKIAKTTNCGANWQVIETGIWDHNHGMSFPSVDTGYAVTKMGYYLKTTNAGINWVNLQQNYTHSFGDVQFVNNSSGFAAGYSNSFGCFVTITVNGGMNWAPFTLDSLVYPEDVCASDTSVWFVAGPGSPSPNYPGFIYRSTNSGISWSYDKFPSRITAINFASKLVGYAATSGSIMYKTTNGGDNWFATECINASPSYGIYFVNNNTGWAVGRGGQIIKTTTGGGNFIGVNPVSNEAPNQFILHQNYPNPFNPVTRIRFQVAGSTNIKLTIYDVIGREIATLVNEQLKPGLYEVPWDGTNYPSGVYFYRLTTNDFTQTRKMVLLK